MIARSLGQPADFFAPFFADEVEPVSVLRLLRYKLMPSALESGVLGCGAHSDYGFLTLLHVKDSASGLEVQSRDGAWLAVKPRKGCFVVNIGDMLSRWTNGVFRSTVHRVVIPRSLEKKPHHRFSIPFFFEVSN